MNNGPLLTVPDVARELSCSRRNIERLLASGELAYVSVGSGQRARRVPTAELQNFLVRRLQRRGARGRVRERQHEPERTLRGPPLDRGASLVARRRLRNIDGEVGWVGVEARSLHPAGAHHQRACASHPACRIGLYVRGVGAQ